MTPRNKRDKRSEGSVPTPGQKPGSEDPAPRNPRAPKLAAAVVFVVTFLVYLRTMPPGMKLGDGLELATAAHVLGVPHPTGYPLYMLLLKLWLLLSVGGEVIVRTSMFSAICISGACATTLFIVVDFLQGMLPRWHEKSRLIAAASVAMLCGFLRFHWQSATITEVYALQLLLSVFFVRQAQLHDRAARPRYLVLAGLTLGLGLAHHRLSVIFIIPYGIMWWHALTAHRIMGLRRVAAVCVAAVFLPLALYAYIPLRAATNPPMNWGNPVTWSAFWNHVTGGDYLGQSFLRKTIGQGFSTSEYYNLAAKQTVALAMDFAGQFFHFPQQYDFLASARKMFTAPSASGVMVLVMTMALALYGAAAMLVVQPRVVIIALLMVLQNLAIVFVYNIPDISDYYLLMFWAGAVCAACGFLRLVRMIGERTKVSAPRPELAYALALLAVLILAGNWRACDQSHDAAGEQLTAIVLPASKEILPEGSVLITGGDYDIFTSWYRQLVRNERRDVLVVGGNFLWKEWYPSLFTPTQKSEYKLRFAKGVARDPREYAKQLFDGVIDQNIATRPVFTSIQDEYVLPILASKYDLEIVQQGYLTNLTEMLSETTQSLYRIMPKSAMRSTR